MTIRSRRSLQNPDIRRPSALASMPRDPSMLWLDRNENLDQKLLEVSDDILKRLDPLALATYPEAGETYRKLAAWAGVDPEQLLLTPGSDGAIRLVFEAFVEHGDAVAHTAPTFAMYPVYSQVFGATVHTIRYQRGKNGPELSPLEIESVLRQHAPKVLCLPNPDSPTGTTLAPDILARILSTCAEVGTVLLIDEAYHPFFDWSAVAWTKTSRNLVVARTFAKAWGLAGLRVGYAVAHPETIAYLHKMRPMYEVGTVAIEFLRLMLEHSDAMAASVARINDGKCYFADAMRTMGFDVLPTQGNFIHVAFGDDSAAIHAALDGKVLYRKNFDDHCLAGYSRFTVAPKDIMEQVIKPIQKAMGEKG